MKEKLQRILASLFSFFIIASIFGGGIIFIMFIMALILGGEAGANLAISASNTVMPYFIRSATISVLVGLISIYIKGAHTLSLEKPNKKPKQ